MLTIEDLGVTRQEATLTNGVKVVLFERPKMPVYLRAVFFSGSRFDPVGKEGTAHFLEHMITAGTKNFPSKDKLAAYIEQYGGGFQAYTEDETLAINMAVGDPKDFTQAVKILHEMLFDSLFEKKVIETERGSILRELGDRKSNPGEMVWEVYRKLYFQGTDFGRSTLGEEKTIKAISRNDLLSYSRKMLVAARMVLVVSGGITLEEISKQVEENLLLPSPGNLTFGKQLPEIHDEKMLIERYKGNDQADFVLGFRSDKAYGADIPALDILAEILGGGRASTLVRKLRYEKGLVYWLFAECTEMSDCGTWFIKTATAKNQIQEALNIIAMEIRRVWQSGLTEEEIRFAKNKIIKSMRMKMQTSFSWVNFHANREILSQGKVWTLSDYVQEIESVTNEMIIKAAKTYFIVDKWYLALCGDFENDAKLEFNF